MIVDDGDREGGLDPNASAVVRAMRNRPIEPRLPLARAESLRRLRARLDGARADAARARKRRLALGAFGALGAAAAIWLSLTPRRNQTPTAAAPLTYTVNGVEPSPSGYIHPGPVPARRMLSFSDGTRIEMEADARGRVVELWRHGARIAIEDGRAHVNVAHRPGAKWLFEAGPFLINVQGTAFSVRWMGRDGRFEMQMETGVVSVTGPVSGGEMVLRAGQKLSIGPHDRVAAPEVVPIPAAAPAAAAVPVAAAAARPVPPSTKALAVGGAAPAGPVERWPTGRWGVRLKEGQADLIMADARRIGIARVLERSGSEDLAALASAARYQHDDALARRVLLAQRRRFPKSVRAGEALFLLGRLEDESGGGAEGALGWYDRYLVEAPDGAYVSEALGRKMMALQRSGRHVEASKIAADYLSRFPSGTYAHAARPLLP